MAIKTNIEGPKNGTDVPSRTDRASRNACKISAPKGLNKTIVHCIKWRMRGVQSATSQPSTQTTNRFDERFRQSNWKRRWL